ncbi:hypothetical protein EXS72_02400 [Candidatus Pacearchaeota archaeon]|nr:hypothetical protein [Candidatus Pacearchaeota archaeon]
MANWQIVEYSKGQFKIQQMVFVLVATLILFAIAFMFFASVKFGGLKSDVESQKKGEIFEQVRKITGTPEFIWSSWEDCAACIDLDKVFMIGNRTSYQGFWKDIALLKISRVYPKYSTDECTAQSYPRCNSITLVEKEGYEAYESFVSLCRYDGTDKEIRCELGKVIMGFEGVGNG